MSTYHSEFVSLDAQDKQGRIIQVGFRVYESKFRANAESPVEAHITCAVGHFRNGARHSKQKGYHTFESVESAIELGRREMAALAARTVKKLAK